ncbi:T9SS type A sorting domain-containing protein [Flavobacterium sp.]|uniref:T9SS type A sorting domain-containing protein n=1 Tax=Flavobacterium sp. TaxID=239 RepID=UPI00375197DA
MKQKILLFVYFTVTFTFGQTIDHIQFEYDAAGNQVIRKTIDILPGRFSNDTIKNIKDLVENDLIKTDLYDDIKYYPNPVLEELYITWNSIEQNKISKIELYSMSGQLLKSDLVKNNTNNVVVSFRDYPQGFYTILLVCVNGERKSLKIVKK